MSLEYEPASEPLHISAKWLFLNSTKQVDEGDAFWSDSGRLECRPPKKAYFPEIAGIAS